MQTQESIQFDTKVQKVLEKLFKNKLTAKAFLIRIIVLMGAGFVGAGLLSTLLTANMMSPQFINLTYIIAPLLGFITLISAFISISLVIRRVKDLVPDTDVWPYALCAVILSLIPFLNYMLYIVLSFLPSNYLNQDKRSQLLGKFA